MYVSQSVLQECQAGDVGASSRRVAIVKSIPLLHVTEESLEIATALVKNGIVPEKAAADAIHISVATVYEMDFLLTWNCRHIANPEIQRNIGAYLVEIGRWLPFICTPEALLGNEMLNDEIVDEVRAIREAHAAQFGFNLRAIHEDLKKAEIESAAAGFTFAVLPVAAPDPALQRMRLKQGITPF